jgi:hypothetical protein
MGAPRLHLIVADPPTVKAGCLASGETLRPMTEGEFTGVDRRLPAHDRENS